MAVFTTTTRWSAGQVVHHVPGLIFGPAGLTATHPRSKLSRTNQDPLSVEHPRPSIGISRQSRSQVFPPPLPSIPTVATWARLPNRLLPMRTPFDR